MIDSSPGSKDRIKTIFHFKECHKREPKNITCLLHLAESYEKGWDGTVSLQQAVIYLKQAKELGNEHAKKTLEKRKFRKYL